MLRTTNSNQPLSNPTNQALQQSKLNSTMMTLKSGNRQVFFAQEDAFMLGGGNAGTCYVGVENLDYQFVCIKVYKRNNRAEQSVHKDYSVYKQLHPQCYCDKVTGPSNNNQHYLLTGLAHGTLSDIFCPEDMQQKAILLTHLTLQVGEQLNRLHLCQKIHGDVKPENILVKKNHDHLIFLLNDFNEFIEIKQDTRPPQDLIHSWNAPEVRQETNQTPINLWHKSDIWSLAHTCCRLAGIALIQIEAELEAKNDRRSLYLQFDAVRHEVFNPDKPGLILASATANPSTSSKWQKNWEKSWEKIKELPEPLNELIMSMLIYDPAHRPELEYIIEKLKESPYVGKKPECRWGNHTKILIARENAKKTFSSYCSIRLRHIKNISATDKPFMFTQTSLQIAKHKTLILRLDTGPVIAILEDVFKIGKGSTACCYVAYDLNTQTFKCLKSYTQANSAKASMREYLFFKNSLAHRTFGNYTLVDDQNQYLMISQLADGTIDNLAKPTPDNLCWLLYQVLMQLIPQIDQIHQGQQFHGDIKGNNILVTQTEQNLNFTLNDFSDIVDLNHDNAYMKSSFHVSSAPETKRSFHDISKDLWHTRDIWSLGDICRRLAGITLWQYENGIDCKTWDMAHQICDSIRCQVMLGHPIDLEKIRLPEHSPEDSKIPIKTLKTWVKGWQEIYSWDKPFNTLIMQMLAFNPAQRPTLDEIKKQLELWQPRGSFDANPWMGGQTDVHRAKQRLNQFLQELEQLPILSDVRQCHEVDPEHSIQQAKRKLGIQDNEGASMDPTWVVIPDHESATD